MIQPKDISLKDIDGHEHHYRISKIPYLSGGREIAAQYALPTRVEAKDYKENQALARMMYKYTAVILPDDTPLMLETDELINNHVPDPQIGVELEKEIYEYNTGFSIAGKVPEYHQALMAALPELTAKTLMHLQDLSSASEPPPSTNSEPSIQ